MRTWRSLSLSGHRCRLSASVGGLGPIAGDHRPPSQPTSTQRRRRRGSRIRMVVVMPWPHHATVSSRGDESLEFFFFLSRRLRVAGLHWSALQTVSVSQLCKRKLEVGLCVGRSRVINAIRDVVQFTRTNFIFQNGCKYNLFSIAS